MRILFLIFLISFFGKSSIAQKQTLNDSSTVVIRSFNNRKLQEFKNDKDFQYELLKEPSKSLWEKFWEWFWWKISEIMRTKTGRTTVWTLLITAGLAAITFFVIKVMGMNNGGLFSRKASSELPYTTDTEDINLIAFDEAIEEAVKNRNFRLAIRLLYLQSLKKLSDKGYIQWQFNKSDSDYIKEVSGKSWQALFKKLTSSFEYAWYGEMNISNDEFQDLQAQFQQFNNQL